MQVLNYSFMDRSPLLGTNYYRLRQVDSDGTMEHSPIRSVLMKGSGPAVRLAPNPGSGVVELLFPDVLPGSVFELLDATGRVVKRTLMRSERTTLDLSALNSGVYGYRVSSTAGGVIAQGTWAKE
jgi:hypothetical protein